MQQRDLYCVKGKSHADTIPRTGSEWKIRVGFDGTDVFVAESVIKAIKERQISLLNIRKAQKVT